MTAYEQAKAVLRNTPRRWLVTGAAGFIGSNLVECLLKLGQTVVGLDNLSTGHRHNLDDVRSGVAPEAWARFRFVEGDIRDLETCRAACEGVDCVLHQAALGSVPRSLEDPVATNASNVTGTLNMLVAARDAGVGRFVCASSSSVYGDHPALPKVEDTIGRPVSPYAVSKYVGELYAGVFHRAYGLQTIALRYFNVFGPRQDPNGAYAAVIPRWISNLLRGVPCLIYGDGETSRDFCHIENVVQGNLLAATVEDPAATGEVYNIACGDRTTLNDLFHLLREGIAASRPETSSSDPVFEGYRPGDVRHSLADISMARTQLRYSPELTVTEGLRRTLEWWMGRPQTALVDQQAISCLNRPHG